ncbi:MAG: hypothetical protein DCE90_09920 [Pseudanabaena sp.]|nr:MAG: hypothetical protein DCE90_09920 [Pseudanabaena sp.]
MIQSNIAFIISHLQVVGDLPVEILPNYIFRSATDSEVEQIKKIVKESLPYGRTTWVPYDAEVVETINSIGHTSYSHAPLPKERWKYWVIAFEGQNEKIHELQSLSRLMPINFEIGLQLFYSEKGKKMAHILISPYAALRYSNWDQAFGKPEIITTAQIASIGELHKMYQNLPDQFNFVRIAVQNFSSLSDIPNGSDLVIVGLFAIIESLITHAPRLSESLDSINHQITNKIMLLRKRFSREVLPKGYFMDAGEDKIWKKLYSYRSAVAHGTPANFEGDHQILKDRVTVIKFLQDNIKELIILGLKEPEFLYDLRKC